MKAMKHAILRVFLPVISLLAASCACSDNSKEEFIPVDGGGSGGTEPAATVVWHERAFETFGAIDRLYRVGSGATAGYYNENYPKGSGDLAASFLWPYDGLMSGVALLNKLGYDVDYKAKVDRFQGYWRASGAVAVGGYGSQTNGTNGGGERYYDDNSIVGLNLVEAYRQLKDPAYLTRCAQIVQFLLSGEDDIMGGALWWCEGQKNKPGVGDSNKPACANGYAQRFLLSYYDICPTAEKADVLAFAKRLYKWERENLLDSSDQTYWNDRNADGSINKTKWTYNSGAMIAAGTRLYHITGEKHYLDEAIATAKGAYGCFVKNRDKMGMAYPLNDPWFTIKLVRAYMELEPDFATASEYIKVFTKNLDYAWEHARSTNGLFYENWSGSRNADRDKSLLMQDAALESLGAMAMYNNEHK